MTNPAGNTPERLDEVRAWGERNLKRARAAEAERDTLQAEVGPVRKQAALWRAGIKPGAAGQLFVDRLPDDIDLDDADAVRLACAQITSAVLGARDELERVGS
jgi:hypothetical protein